MSEFDNLFGNEFFIIDSFNLDEIKTKFYGYSIINNEVVSHKDNIDEKLLDGSGAYILIKTDEHSISISQDFIGCYGIYFFESKNYFAISNSFLKLTEFLKNKQDLSFNEKYANSFLFSNLCSDSYNETLINEIKLLPRNYKIIIDKNKQVINFVEIDFHENTIPLDSQEGIDILDEWYYKWVKLIRSIKCKTNNLSVDLSGGFDSRIVATLWLTSNIDLNKIKVMSYTDKKLSHEEDFIIASKISEEFNFNLNKPSFTFQDIPFKEFNTSLNLSSYIKLGFHKDLNFKPSILSEPLYVITGSGGESIREYNLLSEEYINKVKMIAYSHDPSLVDSTLEVINKSFSDLCEKFNLDKNADNITDFHFKEVRNRHHFGKACVESFYSNRISLTPLLDPILHKLCLKTNRCNDKSLLMTLIFLRYCPKLLDFDFEGGRKISDDTINYAKELNEKYPLVNKEYSYVSGPEIKNIKNNFLVSTTKDYMKKIFYSSSFRKEFLKYYSLESYWDIVNSVETNRSVPLVDVFSSIAILKAINDTNYGNDLNFNDWLNQFIISDSTPEISPAIMSYILKYNKSRIDIKNKGDEDNSIFIINYANFSSNILFPLWFKDNTGDGMVVESINSSLDFKLKCIGDGELIISLKSVDFRDINNNRIPIFIDYINFSINGEDYLNKNTLASVDNPILIKKLVKNSEILNIHVEWNPITKFSEYNF